MATINGPTPLQEVRARDAVGLGEADHPQHRLPAERAYLWLLRKSKQAVIELNRCALEIGAHLKALRSPTARAVAAVLAKARENAGLTQRQLAARIRRPHSVIGMIESDQRQVTVPELITLAEAMDVDPVDLLKRILRDRAAR